MTPLEAVIRARIDRHGPMPVAEYMALCLGHPEHGYYMSRQPLGVDGDFITAPEISQMFGEIIGAWLAQAWLDGGAPESFVLAETGPGRGTLMADMLRTAGRVPGFIKAARILLLETSPVLRAVQAETLAAIRPVWAGDVAELPEGPLFFVANEFFDALPVHQFRRTGDAWAERQVGLSDGELAFVWGRPRPVAALEARFAVVPDGAVVESCPAGAEIMSGLAGRIARSGGAGLVIDYGAGFGTGDTLQAVRSHQAADPLAGPGLADLTAHVDFGMLADAAQPCTAFGPVAQGVFLERLGIAARARTLAKGLSGIALEQLVAAHRRLTHPEEMGNLFRVMAVTREPAPVPPGFGT